MAEKRISGLEETSAETFRTEKQREKKKKWIRISKNYGTINKGQRTCKGATRRNFKKRKNKKYFK